MIDRNGNNLIFLLCAPRSGSSLATVMLQNHSKIFATQEMWFLMSLYDMKLTPHRAYGGTGILNQFFNGVLPGETYEQACRAFALQVYNGLLQSSGADMVVDKSPRYYYLLEFLDALFPHSRRIWLIRNPLSVIASYKKVYQDTNDRFNLKEDLLNPKFDIKMIDITVGLLRYMDYFSGGSSYAYRLSYESMVARPEEELRMLCRFLGLTYEEGLDKYGDFMNTAKADLYYSMGVGDPFVAQHTQPHLGSVDSWKEVLDKREIEMYCRVLGAEVFHKLGYSRQLAEAESLTGASFEMKPDMELIQMRTRQLAGATGCRWEENYRMKTDAPAEGRLFQAEPGDMRTMINPQVLQLQITLRSLEKRLEKSYATQKHLAAQLDAVKKKINRLKSMIPFGRHLSQWASNYLIHSGRKK
ncbi:sulfotransferase [Paenibacillus sp. sptzw28]|uniref:sulfotransferase family protein n=1 Tax=Paenibacillus sp. sptzw28 TaxID=715179 RepID=UPI001C6EB6B7|nr:sulfotransferase [Paenibacillus sp. sptzw28]QYR20608.1 sulfotransferase [Paenibacillus sp. sptzw28]